jgi:hypothetical protein
VSKYPSQLRKAIAVVSRERWRIASQQIEETIELAELGLPAVGWDSVVFAAKNRLIEWSKNEDSQGDCQ